jgi:RNA polymerase sigma-70 factor, ECF subfamily
LSEAFRLALETWPKAGVPANPEGWLVTAAKNRAIDAIRSQKRAPLVFVEDLPDVAEELDNPMEITDRRLALLFVCAHPAIDENIHTPLMLQTVLGFEAFDIARCFIVSPAALAQRLVRAKRKIKDAKIPFRVPDREEMEERLSTVLEVVYGAYALHWMDAAATQNLVSEAVFLADLLATLLPNEPEALGLSALLSLIVSREKARLFGGEYVPLDEQDILLWDHAMINRARGQLEKAAWLKKIGRFQLEASIQLAYAERATTGETNWPAILLLTKGLCKLWPTIGASTSYAAIVGRLYGPEAGLAELDRIAPAIRDVFQPALATRAHLLTMANQHPEATETYQRTNSLTTDPPTRRWLQKQMDAALLPG